MQRHDQEILRMNEIAIRSARLALAVGACLEGKTMNDVPMVQETENNPEFKDWFKKNKKRLMQRSNQKATF